MAGACPSGIPSPRRRVALADPYSFQEVMGKGFFEYCGRHQFLGLDLVAGATQDGSITALFIPDC